MYRRQQWAQETPRNQRSGPPHRPIPATTAVRPNAGEAPPIGRVNRRIGGTTTPGTRPARSIPRLADRSTGGLPKERRQCQQEQPGQAGDCEEPAQLPAGRHVLGRHSQEPGQPGIHHEGFYSAPLQSPLPASGRPRIVDTRPAKAQRSCSKRLRPLKTNSAGEPRIARFQAPEHGDG